MTDPTASPAGDRTPGIPAPTTTPDAAGWYEEDATGLLRYFDGAVWTTRRRSRPATTEEGPPPDLAIPRVPLPTAAADRPQAVSPTRRTTRPSARRPPRSTSPLSAIGYIVCAAVFALGVLTYIRLHDPDFRARCVASRAGLTTQPFPDNLICSLLG